MVKLIIAGSRSFEDWEFFKVKLESLVKNLKIDLVIEGGAKGVDRMGRRWAQENDIPFKTFEADWDTHGRKAGPLRNRSMAEEGTHLVLFWDKLSRGSGDMLKAAKNKNLLIREVLIPPQK